MNNMSGFISGELAVTILWLKNGDQMNSKRPFLQHEPNYARLCTRGFKVEPRQGFQKQSSQNLLRSRHTIHLRKY